MSEGALGSVLVRQDDNTQQSIYFSSHLLKDVEMHYTILENLALALILIAHRLWPYFFISPDHDTHQEYIRQAMTNPKASRRLIKWTIELSEYDLQYQPRTVINAQALVDFWPRSLDWWHKKHEKSMSTVRPPRMAVASRCFHIRPRGTCFNWLSNFIFEPPIMKSNMKLYPSVSKLPSMWEWFGSSFIYTHS